MLEEIESESFMKSGLTGVVFPESVKSVGDHAFMGCAELEKAVDLWLLQADSMKDPYFTSDSPLLEDVENRWVNKFQGVDYGIHALTDTSDWKGFDSIRQDARFTAQLERLKAKKEELEIYFRQRASE